MELEIDVRRPRVPAVSCRVGAKQRHLRVLDTPGLITSKGVESQPERSATILPKRSGQSLHLCPRCLFQHICVSDQTLSASRSALILVRYVGDEASAKSTEFVTALMFAQEYGILAASLEDRPSIPSCHVTFYGAPPDFTAAFRKWQRPAGFTSQHQKLHYVLPLNETLEVLSRKAT